MDQRNEILAKNLVNYSCRVQKGEKVMVEGRGYQTIPLLQQIIKEVYAVGAFPFVNITEHKLTREILLNISREQLEIMAEIDAAEMSKMDAYIGVSAPLNTSELSDVSPENLSLYSRLYSQPVHFDIRIEQTKWVGLRYPNESLAQSANMSTEKFIDYYYKVCNLDYSKMLEAMQPLKELMEKTDKVRIKGEGTDLEFSIKGMNVIPCAGENNIPDGEIFTAPLRDSVNGYITYNTPSEHQGFTYENIRLEFKDGRIIKSTANDTERITKVFDTDEGARYVGEFAIGVNPYITKPMNDTLFDEKIMGSFHFTPGRAYKDAFNGNESAIHWDLVCIQTPEYGGGEIYFDDVLIRKDGVFVVDSLKCLNPENLI